MRQRRKGRRASVLRWERARSGERTPIEAPRASIPYVPIRGSVVYDVLRRSDWRLHVGVQGGFALFGERDVVSEIRKSRHFPATFSPLLGLESGVTFDTSERIGVTAQIAAQSTHFHAEELGTGALPQEIPFTPVSLSVGVVYRF